MGVVIFGIVCILFGTCATAQMLLYKGGPNCPGTTYYWDKELGNRTFTEEEMVECRGPVPWWLMCILDYSYFACMGLQGQFRPRAPSLSAQYALVSDEDFQINQAKLHGELDESD